jgi:GTP-binding protein HflX
MTRRLNRETSTHPKTLLIPVHVPTNPAGDVQEYFNEFLHLVTSNDIPFDFCKEIRLRTIDTTLFFTQGKLDELREFCIQNEVKLIIISEPLSVQQERNLSRVIKCDIIDRTTLILRIFQQHATSAEGKLQVELAWLNYQKSRVAGKGIYLGQQSGYVGTRGPGETQKEKDLQHIERLMLRLQRNLARVEQSRLTQRKRRMNSAIPHFCLIGYTNAGKSSILNALTSSDVIVQNKLFSTLDTTTRELYVEHKKIGLMSDTVGFIQNIPHHLIEAFKSTLHELQYATLLLHVVDISNPNWRLHIALVNATIAELRINKPMIYVLNKADKLSAEELHHRQQNVPVGETALFVSATTLQGLDELKTFLATGDRAA